MGYLFNIGDVFLVEQLEDPNKKLKDVKDFACIAFLIMLYYCRFQEMGSKVLPSETTEV